MKLFLDCEFTNFNADLISMALVSENDDEFYEVVPFRHLMCHPWVIDNVIPILKKEEISYERFQTKLRQYLNRFDEIEVIADWPEDFYHFSRALLSGPGEMIGVNCKITMTLERRLDYKSELPHNALEDAKAVKAGYFKKYTV
jgi:DNA polymerase III epsilon subunit-like protein